MPQAKKRIPGGDKEYRDATRGNKNPPHATIFNNDTTPNANMPKKVYDWPRAPRSLGLLPWSDELWCAWCTENGHDHAHSTADCLGLQDANAKDQWKIIHEYQMCDSCLDQGHYWKDCLYRVQDRCNKCGISHHPNLRCKPPKQPPTYPGAG